MRMPEVVLVFVMGTLAGSGIGSGIQHYHDQKSIEQARQAEMHANGLEDQCKIMLGARDVRSLTHFPDGGWKLEHIPMPECPNDLRRWVDIPERDEVDALSVTCARVQQP